MARDAELRARITAKDDASKVIDKVADKADELDTEEIKVEVNAEVDAALRSFDDLLGEVKQIDAAADALGSALGPELAGKADMRGIVVELQTMGVTLDQISGNADQFAGKLKELSDADVGGKLGANLGTARGKMDELGASVGSSRSALANMVGNSTQDLGALGGMAGSAGVAIGQMGEYIADAAFNGEKLSSVISSFGAIAGPMAAIAVATKMAADTMQRFSDSSERTSEGVERWADALAEGGDAAEAYVDALRDAGGVTADLVRDQSAATNIMAELSSGWKGWVTQGLSPASVVMGRMAAETEDVTAALTRSGISAQRWTEMLMGGAEGEAKFESIMSKTNLTAQERVLVSRAYAQAQDDLATATDNAKITEGFFGDETAKTTALIKALADEGVTAATDAIQENADAMADWAAEMEQAAQAAQDYAVITSSTDWGAASIEGATAGAERFAAAQFGLVNIAAGAEAAYDSLNAAIEENGYTFDLNTEAGRANAEQIQNLYSAHIPAMAAAYADADGDISTFSSSMDTLRTGVMQQLREETSLTEEQIAGVVDQMGLVPANVSSQFEMMGVEDANAKLALLSGVIGSLPENVQRQVTLAVLAGDPQLALDTIEASVSGAELPPAVVDTEVTTQQATNDLKDFTAKDRATNPVKVDANTAAAISTMLYLKVLAMALQPVVTVVADTFPARLALGALASQTTRTSVDAILREYPSASEIAARIGVVRVPVDTYIRNEVRVTGERGVYPP